MPNYFPIMLDIRGRRALVIGGDQVAAQKAASLAASGADVIVQSQQFCPQLLALAEQQRLSLRQKAYEPGDLAGAFVVIAATGDRAFAQALWQEAQANGQLINIVDMPSCCSFIIPSVLRRGQLTISVSTEGASPGLARRIRQQLEESFPSAYDAYLRLATIARARLRSVGVSYEQRDAFFGAFFASDVLPRLVEGAYPQAVARTVELLQAYGVDVAASVLLAEFEEGQAHVNTHR
jgi:precorrin-2 dehydrogenase/sirohydrochlorin ferrochelatase